MIESAVDVLTHPMLAKGVVAGLVVLVLGIVLASVRSDSRVQRYGGLMVAAGTMLVLFHTDMLGRSQVAGIALLALAIFPVYIAISSYSTRRWGRVQVIKNVHEDGEIGRASCRERV